MDVPSMHAFFKGIRSRIRRAVAVNSVTVAAREYKRALPKEKSTDQSKSGFAPYESPLNNATDRPSGTKFDVLNVEDGEVQEEDGGQSKVLVPNSQPDGNSDSTMEDVEETSTGGRAVGGGDDDEFTPDE